MVIILMTVAVYILCVFIKPMWKALLIGYLAIVLVSVLIHISSPNYNTSPRAMEFFIAGSMGEGAVPILLGAGIFGIFYKEKKKEPEE